MSPFIELIRFVLQFRNKCVYNEMSRNIKNNDLRDIYEFKCLDTLVEYRKFVKDGIFGDMHFFVWIPLGNMFNLWHPRSEFVPFYFNLYCLSRLCCLCWCRCYISVVCHRIYKIVLDGLWLLAYLIHLICEYVVRDGKVSLACKARIRDVIVLISQYR